MQLTLGKICLTANLDNYSNKILFPEILNTLVKTMSLASFINTYNHLVPSFNEKMALAMFQMWQSLHVVKTDETVQKHPLLHFLLHYIFIYY